MLHLLKEFTLFDKFLAVSLLVICLLLSSHLWHQDVLFHTDVARDFLVIQEIVSTKAPTLIGPRSGGVSGVFHGPLWYYVSLIPFIIVNGNPVMMGWFWWLLGIAAIILFFIVSVRLTKNITSSLLTTIAFTLLLLPSAAGPINTFLADIFSFAVFAIWVSWYTKPTLTKALAGWFLLGVLVQFQMAFAIPIALIWLFFFVIKIKKEKLFKQLLTPLAFLPPLATFVAFDLRHDWLQVRSVLAYLSAHRVDSNFLIKFWQRLQLFLFDGVHVFGFNKYLSPFVLGLFFFLTRKNKDKTLKSAIIIAAIWYVGWWTITLLFSGDIWNYYFSQFFGIILLIISMLASKHKLAQLVLGISIIFSLFNAKSALFYNASRFNSSSWSLLSQIAHDGLLEPSTGYFLYSQDQFAYPLKYAFSYYKNNHLELDARSFSKQPLTILVKAADDPNNPYSTSKDWQLNKLRINMSPYETKEYQFGYVLEKYKLDKANLETQVDPNIITDLHFR